MSVTRNDYHVVYCHDAVSGIAVRESWYRTDPSASAEAVGLLGPIERIGAPAVIFRDRVTGVIVHEEWYKNGQLHRDNGPALIYRDPATGEVKRTSWYQNGQLVRYGLRPKQTASRRPGLPQVHP